ncbi:MAG: hypothetical protein M3417_00075 [Actinomycetota bacterium]|nr:hypothetical protein [Actinomycetota bacterium]
MTLWWIGNIVLIAVVIPVVIVILRRVMAPVREIQEHAADLVPVAKSIEDKLEAVIHLVRTQYQIKETRRGIRRYGAALDEIL